MGDKIPVGEIVSSFFEDRLGQNGSTPSTFFRPISLFCVERDGCDVITIASTVERATYQDKVQYLASRMVRREAVEFVSVVLYVFSDQTEPADDK